MTNNPPRPDIARLEAALWYCTSMQWPVMPVDREGSKKPCVKWKPYQTERPTPEIIEQWWSKFPAANVGLITGELAGCFVVETDSPEASAWLLDQNLPPGPVAESSQEFKRHYYFRHPGFRVANSQSQIAPNIDVRGDGGYVVVPPSVHHTGVIYQWIVSPEDVELPDAPGWLLDAIVQRSEPPANAQRPSPIRPDDPTLSRWQKYARRALENEVRNVATAPDGKKHEIVRNSSISMGTLVPHGIISAAEIKEFLFSAIAGRAKDKANAAQTIEDGIAYGIKYPRDLPKDTPSPRSTTTYTNGAPSQNGAMHRTTTAVPPPVASAPAPAAEPDWQEPSEPQEPPQPLYEVFTFNDLAKLPRPEWLIRGMLVEKVSSILSADSGSFKSFIALSMGLCIATGREFHGNEVKQGGVVYVAAEGFYTMQDRATAWSLYHDCPLPDNFHIFRVPVNLADPAIVEGFAAQIEALAPVFVVLDTLSQNAIGLNENDNAHMANFVRGMMRLGYRIGAHIQVLHHNAKASGAFRGASSIKANVDSHIALEKLEGDFSNWVHVKCEKQRGRPFKMFTLEGHEIELPYTDEYEKPITSLVFDLADVSVLPDADHDSKHPSTARSEETRDELMLVFDQVAEEADKFHVDGVKLGFWRAAAEKAGICKERAFYDHFKALEKDGVIEECGYHKTSKLFRRVAGKSNAVACTASTASNCKCSTCIGTASCDVRTSPKGDVYVPSNKQNANEINNAIPTDIPALIEPEQQPTQRRGKRGSHSEPYNEPTGEKF